MKEAVNRFSKRCSLDILAPLPDFGNLTDEDDTDESAESVTPVKDVLDKAKLGISG